MAGAFSWGHETGAMCTSIRATRSGLTWHALNPEHVASPVILAVCERKLNGWCVFVGARDSSDVHIDTSKKE
jgi:hypothetical protein